MGRQDGGRRCVLVLLLAGICVCAEAASTRRCTTCSPHTVQDKVENALRLELIKRQILDRLGLDARPNITKAVPRKAIHTALRRLHAEDLITQVTTPAPEDHDDEQQEHHEEAQTVEIISFAEAGESTPFSNFKVKYVLPIASHCYKWTFSTLGVCSAQVYTVGLQGQLVLESGLRSCLSRSYRLLSTIACRI